MLVTLHRFEGPLSPVPGSAGVIRMARAPPIAARPTLGSVPPTLGHFRRSQKRATLIRLWTWSYIGHTCIQMGTCTVFENIESVLKYIRQDLAFSSRWLAGLAALARSS